MYLEPPFQRISRLHFLVSILTRNSLGKSLYLSYY